jgi:tetratricopeptide (TPR) repeat protein
MIGNSQEHCMKKLVFASAMALAALILVPAAALRAQDIQIQDPAEFNAFQNASTQSDPAAQSSALESFLTTYPQSVAKKSALDTLVDAYQKLGQPDKLLSAAKRMLQVDANNFKAIFWSVYVEKMQCAKSIDANTGFATDTQTCDDAGVLAQKGLTAPKPAGTSDADWKKLTDNAYPIFHSTIAYDNLFSKKDLKGAIDEYTKELLLYPPDATTKPGLGLQDTLQLAQVYSKPGATRDEIKAVWFYARAWDFAPASFKQKIEDQLDYRYKHYHGTLDGDAAINSQIDAIKAKAQATLFPPADFTIAPAPTPAELAHHAYTEGDPSKLSLEDIEFILANGYKADADGLWALLKGKATPVPGIVIAAPVSALKVVATTAASPKPKEFIVKLATPAANLGAIPSELKIKDAQDFILANGAKADTDALGEVLTETPAHFKKIAIELVATEIDVAVTNDAKDKRKADFIVNLKTPATAKEIPATGSTLALQPATELDGTYETYTKVAGDATSEASAQIVLGEGLLQVEKKSPAGAHHPAAKPAAGHRAQ